MFGIINVSSNLRDKINNEVYTWYLSRDRYLLKLLCNRGKFRKKIFFFCPLCLIKENSREYAVNECCMLENERVELRREIEEIWKDSKEYTTWDIITKLYFGEKEKTILELKDKRKAIKKIKWFCGNLFEKYRKIKAEK